MRQQRHTFWSSEASPWRSEALPRGVAGCPALLALPRRPPADGPAVVSVPVDPPPPPLAAVDDAFEAATAARASRPDTVSLALSWARMRSTISARLKGWQTEDAVRNVASVSHRIC